MKTRKVAGILMKRPHISVEAKLLLFVPGFFFLLFFLPFEPWVGLAIGSPFLLAAVIALKWPLHGSLIAILLSAVLLIISTMAMILNYESSLGLGFLFLVFTLMYLTGAIMVFTSARKSNVESPNNRKGGK